MRGTQDGGSTSDKSLLHTKVVSSPGTVRAPNPTGRGPPVFRGTRRLGLGPRSGHPPTCSPLPAERLPFRLLPARLPCLGLVQSLLLSHGPGLGRAPRVAPALPVGGWVLLWLWSLYWGCAPVCHACNAFGDTGVRPDYPYGNPGRGGGKRFSEKNMKQMEQAAVFSTLKV